VLLRFLLRECTSSHEAREAIADVELGLLQSLDGEVAGDYSMAGLGGELDDAGAHRANAEDADGLVVIIH
jgi:hypothetical protein